MNIFEEIEESFRKRYTGWTGREQFIGTGARLSRMVEEMCWLPERVEKELESCFGAVYDDNYDEMLTIGGTSVWTLCPHHLVPCNFLVYIGYIPNGKVLGLSKFSRVSLILGKRPIMQEQYTRELGDAIMQYLEPKGVGVYVRGKHGCIGCRGVTQDIGVVTTVLKGCMLADSSAKEEFLRAVGGLS